METKAKLASFIQFLNLKIQIINNMKFLKQIKFKKTKNISKKKLPKKVKN